MIPCHLILSLITVEAQELYRKHRGFSKGHLQSKRPHLALRNLLLSLALVSLARREGVGGSVCVRAVAELPMPLRRSCHEAAGSCVRGKRIPSYVQSWSHVSVCVPCSINTGWVISKAKCSCCLFPASLWDGGQYCGQTRMLSVPVTRLCSSVTNS